MLNRLVASIVRARFASQLDSKLPKTKLNMFTAINKALDFTLENDKTAVLFGEDVKFGGVFRCSIGLNEKYGTDRVFNTPLCQQGIAGFGIGLASIGITAIAQIQFSDYIFPAFDQLVNEAAKFRYRSGGQFHCGSLTVRSTWGAVGHGGLYHSQSPEAYFAHTPGLKVVVPRDAIQAKGLLRASILDKNPVIFFEPKALYRNSQEQVPDCDFALDLHRAQVTRSGKDCTIISYGTLLKTINETAKECSAKGIDCQVIDLQTIYPYDSQTLIKSVNKTGRCIIVTQAPTTCGMGAELTAKIQEKCLLRLKAPIKRLGGLDTPFPLVHQPLYLPDKWKIKAAIEQAMSF